MTTTAFLTPVAPALRRSTPVRVSAENRRRSRIAWTRPRATNPFFMKIQEEERPFVDRHEEWIAGVRRTPCAQAVPSYPHKIAIALHAAAPIAPVHPSHLACSSTISVHDPGVKRQPRRQLPRPCLVVLIALAAVARRLKRLRTAPGFRLARASASFALAAVGLAAVSRGILPAPLALVGSAASAPAPTAGPLQAAIQVLVNLVPERMRIFVRPFTEAFGVVFVSEFGDKSMFATALMAMKHSPFLVLTGALVALTLMTLIACFLGQLMHLLPTTVTHYSTIALFVFFGFQMILQARNLPSTPGIGADGGSAGGSAGGERADAEEMVAKAQTSGTGSLGVFAKVSSLIFVAEWCDRSMLATMALAATSNTAAVIGGATAANFVCSSLAVSAAALVSSRISERLVALVAGIMFEFFAIFTFLEGPENQ